MTSKINIRRYKDGDEYGIVELFKKVFGREMTLEEWQWKYKGQDFNKVYSFVITNEKNEIVGHYGGIPLRILYKGKEITGISTCDVMIDKRYRGFWILRRLHNEFVNTYIKEGISMFYGFPTEKTLLLPAEKLGLYERVETIYEASKEVKFHNGPGRFLYRLIPIDLDNPEIDRLWSSVKGDFQFSVIRDNNYLKWRYKRNPLFSYEAWALKKRFSKRLEGLIILKKEDRDELLLMDIVFKKGLLNILIKKTENLAFFMKKKRLLMWLPQRMQDILRKLGFQFKPSGATLPKATHKRTIPKEEIFSHFYYTCGDTDFL